MKLLRRGFLKGALGSTLAPSAIVNVACSDSSEDASTIGDLEKDPDGIVDLPQGYSYVVLQRTGDEMSDGHPMGARPDGMACFEDEDGHYVLMRNHEVDIGASPEPDVAYNPNMAGGVSRVVIDPDSLEVLESNYVLVGTNRNCAGGPSPWGWLSCEETEDPGHGYVFVCDPRKNRAQEPQRAVSLGRFKHEAAAVDPRTETIYLTEDNRRSAFYRHVPDEGPFLGTLQAMRIVDEDQLDLSEGLAVGDSFEVSWVAIDEPDPSAGEESTAEQAFSQGAAIVNRGEGCWYSEGAVFFVSTEGGPVGKGQVFRLDIEDDAGTLTLIAQVEEDEAMINPDNITVSPAGEVFVVEDNNGPNHIHRVNADGTIDTLAKNALNDGTSEFCGVCFSPDGSTLFVNIQEQGLTLAVRGPFARA